MPIQYDTQRLVQPPKGELGIDMALDQIPLSEEQRKIAEKLIADDTDPCWVAQEIAEGKGNWGEYKASAIQSIVNQVNQRQPSGYLGHQKPGDIPYQFPEPVTHWFAAEMVDRGGKAAARIYGLVDKKFTDLRRWIRSRRINEVSIFGYPQYKSGTKDIIGYKLRSIDWTPRDGAGLGSQLLWATGGEMGAGRYDVEVNVEGEIVHVNPISGEVKMDMKELLATVRAAIAKGELSVADMMGECGLTGEQVVPELTDLRTAQSERDALAEALGCGEMEASDAVARATAMREAYDKLAETGADDVPAFVGELLDTRSKALQAESEQALADAIDERVKGESARKLIRRLLGEQDGKTKDEICGEIDALLADEDIKSTLSKLSTDGPTYDRAGGGGERKGFKSGKSRKVSV